MIFPPLPQPYGDQALRDMAETSGLYQLVMIVVGMIAAGVLLIWWKLRSLDIFRPGKLYGATLHRLDPSSYRDDTGTSR
jgi:hypothetical protein